ncbi:MAG: 50S ribosomal protein L29 [Bacteroidia bacterium]|nr:50S ribosomal protein L29 [Bacteroidia bacterium]
MKKFKTEDIRQLTDEEIMDKIAETKAMIHQIRYNHAISHVENPARIRVLRRNVARMYTVLTERKNAVGKK